MKPSHCSRSLWLLNQVYIETEPLAGLPLPPLAHPANAVSTPASTNPVPIRRFPLLLCPAISRASSIGYIEQWGRSHTITSPTHHALSSATSLSRACHLSYIIFDI